MTAIYIDGFPVEYQAARIPRYRGTSPQPIEIYGISRYEDIKSIVAGAKGGFVTLTIKGPATPGGDPGEDEVTMKDIIIERLTRMTSKVWKLEAYDKRLLLRSRVADQNFMMTFGDDYLEGTEETNYSNAIQAMCLSHDVLKDNMDSGAYSLIPSIKTEDDIALAGYGLEDQVAYLSDRASVDLDTLLTGKFRFADRADIAGAQHLPNPDDYRWAIAPGWVYLDNVITNRPRKIRAYYWERHCIAMQGADPTTTISTAGDDTVAVQLEQVYVDKGVYHTLDELLVAFGYAAGDVSDAEIAGAFMTGTMQGTAIERDGSDNNDRLLNAIHDGWRRLWRVQFPKTLGHIGGWSEWDFGTLNADGSVTGAAVDCAWVEFLSVLSDDGSGTFDGASATKNNAKPAPFVPTWDAGPAGLVIRLKQKELSDPDNFAMPGALVSPLTVKTQNTVSDDAGQDEVLRSFKVIEVEDKSKAKFTASFSLTLYMVATRRMPNNEYKWHVENVDGFGDGDIEYVELPPSAEVFCYRDYVDGTSGHTATADGLGPVLNTTQINDDAERRAEGWKITHAAALEGEALAEGIAAFRDVELRGPVNSVVLELGEDATARTRITVGNLGDKQAREMVAQRRMSARKQREAGKAVA